MSAACPKCGTPGGRDVTHVCMTAGRVEGPWATGHVCTPPFPLGLTSPIQPDWTCGICGRVWRDWNTGALRYWAEVVGPSREALGG